MHALLVYLFDKSLHNNNRHSSAAECAPGYAGKGMNGVCKKCPSGANIALGGPVSRSVCIKCPKGSYVNQDSSECVCPSGHYKVVADQPLGYAKMVCKPCVARTAYVEEEGHSQNTCNYCQSPLVANKDHNSCGRYCQSVELLLTRVF